MFSLGLGFFWADLKEAEASGTAAFSYDSNKASLTRTDVFTVGTQFTVTGTSSVIVSALGAQDGGLWNVLTTGVQVGLWGRDGFGDPVLLKSVIVPRTAPEEAGGYRYVTIDPVTLEPGIYWIGALTGPASTGFRDAGGTNDPYASTNEKIVINNNTYGIGSVLLAPTLDGGEFLDTNKLRWAPANFKITTPTVHFSSNFNTFTGSTTVGAQHESGLDLVSGANLSGWDKQGVDAVALVNMGTTSPDWAAILFHDTVLTLTSGVDANAAGVTYTVSVEVGPSAFNTSSHLTTADERIAVWVLDEGNDRIGDGHLLNPGAWGGGQSLTAQTFTYVGNGVGAVKYRIFTDNPTPARIGGAIDNFTVTSLSQPSLPAVTWVAAYGFKAGSLLDSSGRTNTLVLGAGSPTSEADRNGNASGSWRGSGSAYLRRAAGLTDFNATANQLTVSAWIKTASSAREMIASMGRSPTSFSGQWAWGIDGGKLNFYDYAGGYGFEDVQSETLVNDGAWHHVAFVRNGLTGTFYIDGVARGTYTAAQNTEYNNVDLVVGGDWRNDSEYWTGSLDELAISSTALSAAQISAIAAGDSDVDGLTDAVETGTGNFVSATNTGSNPYQPDTDGDGQEDGVEVKTAGTNPNLGPDADNDGLSDAQETNLGTDPNAADPAATTVGTPFTFTVSFGVGSSDYAATGLPAGLSISATTGEITGTPTAVTTPPGTVVAVSAQGSTGGPVSRNILFRIDKGNLVLSGISASAITYGKKLSDSTLAGTAKNAAGDIISGTWAFQNPATQPNVGNAQNFPVTFTPGQTENYNTASGTVSLNVTGAALPSVTFTGPASLTYDGTGKAYTAAASGVSGFSYSYSGRNGTGYGPSELAPKNAGDYTVTATSTDPNYTGTAGQNFTISKAVLSLSGITGKNKVYDGNRAAEINGLISLSGRLGSDDVSLTGALNYQFSDPNVGTDKPIAVSGGSLSGAAKDNYSLVLPTDLKASITTRGLTITGISIADKPFDGTKTATIAGTAIYVGLQGADDFAVTGTPVAEFSSPDVGADKAVTVSGYTAPSANYTVSQPSGLTASIIGAAMVDTDGDGLSDEQEAVLGTSPTLSQTPGTLIAKQSGTSGFVATWGAVAGAASYEVQVSIEPSFTTGLLGGDRAVPGASSTSLAVAGVTNQIRYYRVRSVIPSTGEPARTGWSAAVSAPDLTAFGNYVSLNASGNSDNIQAAVGSSANNGSYTITFWMRPDRIGGVSGTEKVQVFRQPINSITAAANVDIDLLPNGSLTFGQKSEAGVEMMVTSGAKALLAENWYHVAAVRDAANSTLRLYLNGNEVAVNPSAFGATPSWNIVNSGGPGATQAALNNDGNTNRIRAAFDDVRIYRSVRTAAQILEDMATPLTKTQANGDASLFFYATWEGTSVSGTDSNSYYKGSLNGTPLGTVTPQSVPLAPVLIWAPDPIANLTAPATLSTNELTAVAKASLVAIPNLPGSWSYSPAAGASLVIGTNPIVATFVPQDLNAYSVATMTNRVVVTGASLPTVTFTGPASLTYDGTGKAYTAAASGVSGFSYSYSGRNGTGYGPSELAPKNAGDYTVTATSTDPNYTGTAEQNFTIAKATASISISNVNQTYDGLSKQVTVTTTPSALAVLVQYNGSYAPPVNAGTYPVLVTVNDSNHTGSQSGTLTIEKANPTVTAAPTAAAITYGQALTASTLTGGTASPTGTFAFKDPSATPNAGLAQNFKVVFTPGDTANYRSLEIDVPVTVTKAAQTITFSPLADRAFGESDFSLAATASSGLPVAYSTVATNVISISGGTVTILAAGDATITATQAGDANYEPAAPVQQNLKVKSAQVAAAQIALTPPASLEYDKTPKVFTASSSVTAVTNFVLRYKSAGDGGAGNTFAPTEAGDYTVTAEVWQANYTGTGTTNFTITPRPLTVTANATNKIYQDNDPAFTYTTSGLVAGDSGALGGSLTRQPGNNAGKYAILSNGLSVSPNYQLSFVSADFTILPKPLGPSDFIFTPPASLVYNGTPRAFVQALISGLVPGQAEYSGRNSTVYISSTNAPTAAGDYTLKITPTDANYTGSGSTNFVVAQAPLTITGITGKGKVYDGNRAADINGLVSLSGKVGSDDVALTGALNYQFDDPNVGVDKLITVSGGSLSGAAKDNYSLVLPTDLKASITTRGLTITGISISDKPFDGTTTAMITGTATYVGLQGTDDFAVTGTPTAAFGTPEVGANKPVTVSGYTAPSANYTVTQPSGLTASIIEPADVDSDGDGIPNSVETKIGTAVNVSNTFVTRNRTNYSENFNAYTTGHALASGGWTTVANGGLIVTNFTGRSQDVTTFNRPVSGGTNASAKITNTLVLPANTKSLSLKFSARSKNANNGAGLPFRSILEVLNPAGDSMLSCGLLGSTGYQVLENGGALFAGNISGVNAFQADQHRYYDLTLNYNFFSNRGNLQSSRDLLDGGDGTISQVTTNLTAAVHGAGFSDPANWSGLKITLNQQTGSDRMDNLLLVTEVVFVDSDGDGLADAEETNTGVYVSATDTGTDPAQADTDGDGLKDGEETKTGIFVSLTNPGTDPNDADSDNDGLQDGVETGTGAFVSNADTGTNPNLEDTDGDGLKDGFEVNLLGSNPLLTDTDRDGLSDKVETGTGIYVSTADTGTDPALADTDGDGLSDGVETGTGTFVAAPGGAQLPVTFTIVTNNITAASDGGTLASANPGSMSGKIMHGTNEAGEWFLADFRYTRKAVGGTRTLTGAVFATNTAGNPYPRGGVGMDINTGGNEPDGVMKFSYRVQVAMKPGYRAAQIFLLGRNPTTTRNYGPAGVATGDGGSIRISGFPGTNTGIVGDPNDNLVAAEGDTFSSGADLLGYKGVEKTSAQTTWYLRVPASEPISYSLDLTGQASASSESTAFSVQVFQEDTGTSPVLADTDGDGVNDGTEVTAGRDPNVAPRAEIRLAAVSTGYFVSDRRSNGSSENVNYSSTTGSMAVGSQRSSNGSADAGNQRAGVGFASFQLSQLFLTALAQPGAKFYLELKVDGIGAGTGGVPYTDGLDLRFYGVRDNALGARAYYDSAAAGVDQADIVATTAAPGVKKVELNQPEAVAQIPGATAGKYVGFGYLNTAGVNLSAPVGNSFAETYAFGVSAVPADSALVVSLADFDDDGLADAFETNTGTYVSASNTGTNPAQADTDADGVKDGAEVAAGTNPLVKNILRFQTIDMLALGKGNFSIPESNATQGGVTPVGFQYGTPAYYGGVPFFITDKANQVWHAAQAPGGNGTGPVSVTFPIAVNNVYGFYTLAGLWWGVTGSFVTYTFNFSDGSSYSKILTNGTDLRDYNIPSSFLNTINGTTTQNVFASGGYHLDRQWIDLAAAGHGGKNLVSFTVTDNGAWGSSRIFLAAATAQVGAPGQIPPGATDTDLDGIPDSYELGAPSSTKPDVADTDNDGLNDGVEVGGVTDPLDPDTDNDGLLDGQEVNTYGSDPLIADTDGDELSDKLEVDLGLSPTNFEVHNQLTNGSFEDGAVKPSTNNFITTSQTNVPGWKTTANNNFTIELWYSGFNPDGSGGSSGGDGNTLAELNYIAAGTLYQDVTMTKHATVSYSFLHRGRSGTETMEFRIDRLAGGPGSTVEANFFTRTVSTGNGAWVRYLGTPLGTVEAGKTYRFSYTSVIPASGGSGNLIDAAAFEIDSDGDGLGDSTETGTGIYVSLSDAGTNPNDDDSDNDGLKDGVEVLTYGTSPLVADSDGDGVVDSGELAAGTDPLQASDRPVLLSAGWNHTLYLPNPGQYVLAWGLNGDGRCGLGDTNSPVVTAQKGVYRNLEGANQTLLNLIAVSAGGNHSLVLQRVGSVNKIWAAGANLLGQLGRPTNTLTVSEVFREVPGGVPSQPVAIAAGARHNLALGDDKRVYAWGDNSQGQLGLGTTVAMRDSPAPVPGLINVKAIAAGADHSVALTEDGKVYAWGRGNSGQLGYYTLRGTNAPRLITGIPVVAQIAAGDKHTLLRTTNGAVYSCGANTLGQAGLPASTTFAYTPTQLVFPGSGVFIEKLIAGLDRAHAVAASGKVYAWGYNYYGELGLGFATTTPPYGVFTPTEVLALFGSKEIASGGYQTFALDGSGTLAGSGLNEGGQLGTGSTTNVTTGPAPTQEAGKTNQIIAFTLPAGPFYTDTSLTLTASTDSGLNPVYTSSDPAVAAVEGATLQFLSAGSIRITASQPGDATYNAAQAVAYDITVVDPPPLTLQLGGSTGQLILGATGTNSALVDGGLQVLGRAATTVTAATVKIVSGRQTGDTLAFSGYAGPLTASYNPNSGTLRITGSNNLAGYQEALQKVVLETTNRATVDRVITLALGSGVAFTNGHVYEYVNTPADWPTARNAAKARKIHGQEGYLANVTSAEENAFLLGLLQEAGQNAWLGAADITDANFRWMDGPEAGLQFWNGNSGGSAVAGKYANWGAGEPNDFAWWTGLFSRSYESYVAMLHSTSYVIGGNTRSTSPGKWNDAPLKTGSSSFYRLGYLVEHGASATEPLLFAKTRTLRPLSLTWRFNGDGVAVTGYSGGGGEVVIPATLGGLTVNRIDPEAFKDKATLTQITIPTGVRTIGSYAFANCTGLTSIYFEGDAPILETGSGEPFAFVTATVYYRSTKSGWGASYGGLTTAAYTSPGSSPGRWDFAAGNYSHTSADGMLLLELGGLEGTTLYDQIFVRNGAATLDGIVNLMFYGTYTGPVSGAFHTFDLIWAQNGITFGDDFQFAFAEPGFAVDTAVVEKDGGQLWQATVRQASGPEEVAAAGAIAQPFLGNVTSPGPGGVVEILYTYTRVSGGSYLNGRYTVGAMQYEVQISPDLRTWNAAAVEETSVIPSGSGYESATVRVISGTGRAFLRLKVSN